MVCSYSLLCNVSTRGNLFVFQSRKFIIHEEPVHKIKFCRRVCLTSTASQLIGPTVVTIPVPEGRGRLFGDKGRRTDFM